MNVPSNLLELDDDDIASLTSFRKFANANVLFALHSYQTTTSNEKGFKPDDGSDSKVRVGMERQ